jgi:hypothetical protein
MLEYARKLPSGEAAEVISSADPLTDPVLMRYSESERRHFEGLKRTIAGFLVFGDALCSFNPIYGQGMTVAALEAQLLEALLADRGTDDLAPRFHKSAGKLLSSPWSLACGGDLRFPEVVGKRAPGSRLLERYLDRYRAAAAVDARLGQAFLNVANMVSPPTALLAPELVARALRARLR